MNRVRDYIQFVICFVGIGYMVLWPLTAHDVRIALFSVASSCHAPAVRLIAVSCQSSHWLRLTPGLDLLGLASAVCVLVRLVLRCLVRWRYLAATGALSADARPDDGSLDLAVRRGTVDRIVALLRRSTSPPAPPPRPVRPRNHFGLRGAPD